MIADTPQQIELYQMLVLRSALKLEMLGLKTRARRTAYSAIKKMFNLKGSRQKVYDTFKQIVATTKEREVNE